MNTHFVYIMVCTVHRSPTLAYMQGTVRVVVASLACSENVSIARSRTYTTFFGEIYTLIMTKN
jgi:hypothetical protein